MSDKTSKRIMYIIAFVLTVVTEVCIALWIHDGFIRPYLGDVFVVFGVYFFVRIFIPEKVMLMPLYVFLFAVFVECMQYINIVSLLGLENNFFFKILIGSTFDWSDILCYFVGCTFLMIYELANKYKRKIRE